ncbi:MULTISPECIES: hypothetical protein [Pseudanabaena]|uniref:hypothetical protein n=1 Tax=Pseudanabaena TaxID=1152 RepID=UPI00247AE9FE|nr:MULTISPECIES: hypothetical protein [Pseudanabaena]MEA5488006.1 hypothetical protein [Pseudanabaena sp. CCNP1317]WGS71812.1 hypothetical protein OA858_19225 [Pseudanabaena galeata CCNP1313]
MESPDINSPSHAITIHLSSELYESLVEKTKITGKTESELVIQGLHYILGNRLGSTFVQQEELERFSALEATLEQKLKQYVEHLIKDRVSSSELVETSSQGSLNHDLDYKRNMPIPTIRPLQVGDRVLILEPDSPYYMAKLLVIRTSLIRATVDTETGEKTFLKRDLRFVESANEE